MNRIKRNKQGFTLIELIIVIAILAILAGVAIPVYSGYANKANEAADLQLLGAVNTAFSAACLSHGVDPRSVNASADLNDEHHLVLSLASAELYGDFLSIFGPNANTPFRYYTSLAYDKANGVFVDGNQTKTVGTGEGAVSATMAQLADFQNSAFGEIGFAALGADFSQAANAVAAAVGNGIAVIANKDNADSAASELYPFLRDHLGLSDGQIENLTEQQIANAMILYTASASDPSMDRDTALEKMSSFANTDSPSVNLASDMLLAYSITESYVNSEYATPEQKNAFDAFKSLPLTKITPAAIRDLVKSMLIDNTDPGNGFLQYMNSNGNEDIKGYMSALEMINDNTDDLSTDRLLELLGEDFSSSNGLYSALSALLGN